MEEKPKYPNLDIGKCPVCGSTRQLADEVLQHQIKEGRLPASTKAFIFQYQSIVAGATWFSAPMILSFFDVCVDCGTVYCIHAEVKTAVQGRKNLPKAGGNFSVS